MASASSPPPLSFNVVGSDTLTDSNTVSSTPPSSSSPLQSINPTILITIIALATAVILSVALCFIIPHLNRRRLRRMSTSSTAPATTTAPVFSSSRRVSPEVPSSSVIDSLPLFTFSSITRRSSASAGDCAVCLSKFEQDDLLRLLPLCCHAFHAECVDTWLQSNLTCPLCRSAVFASEDDIMKVLRQSSSAAGGNSFRLEIGNVSRRGDGSAAGEARARSRSYSIGSFEYFVDDYSEVPFSHAHRRSVSDNKDEIVLDFQANQPDHEPSLVADVGSGRSWLKDYVDRLSASLSSRTMSFRSSGRFLNGSSSRRSDAVAAGDYDVESNRIGEEISEMFGWLSAI